MNESFIDPEEDDAFELLLRSSATEEESFKDSQSEISQQENEWTEVTRSDLFLNSFEQSSGWLFSSGTHTPFVSSSC